MKSETVVIHTAQDFFKACKEHLETKQKEDGSCLHFLQTFHFTNKLATRPNTGKWRTVPETQKIHSITNSPGTSLINLKNMLCCCIGCMNGTECLNDVCPEPWKGFDLVQKKFLTPNLESWSICLICKNFLSTDNVNYWTEHIDKLSSITLFTDLIQYIQWNPLPPLQANINNVMTENDKQFLDFVALHYIPNDAPDSYAPVAIVGDGNLLSKKCQLCFVLNTGASC